MRKICKLTCIQPAKINCEFEGRLQHFADKLSVVQIHFIFKGAQLILVVKADMLLLFEL